MTKVQIIDNEKTYEVEVPEYILHISNLTNQIAAIEIETMLGSKNPWDGNENSEWDNAYAFLTNYFENIYCDLTDRHDEINDLSGEFIVTSKEDINRGIEISVRILDLSEEINLVE